MNEALQRLAIRSVTTGAFRSAYSPGELLSVVDEVARHSASEDPRSVSQRQWDASRAAVGHPRAPTARAVCQRLGKPWATVLRIASEEEGVRRHRSGVNDRTIAEYDLTKEVAIWALKLVAARLGQFGLSMYDYEKERAIIMGGGRGRDVCDLWLPTAKHLRDTCGRRWKSATELAGLRPGTTGSSSNRCEPVGNRLDECLAAHGAQPTYDEFYVFLKVNELSCSHRTEPWPQTVAIWKATRVTRGLAVPDGPPPLDQRPDYAMPLPDWPFERSLPRDGAWGSRDTCIDALALFLQSDVGLDDDTYDAYRDWATGRLGVPSIGRLDRHGSFVELRRLAYERLRSVS